MTMKSYFCAIILGVVMVFTQLAESDGQARIVGGDTAFPAEFPYFVSLGDCGGSLISPSVVLTAAHCRFNMVGKNVVVGAYSVGLTDGGAKEIRVIEDLEHPNYDDVDLTNDLRLLRLAKPFTIASNVFLLLNEQTQVPANGQDLTVIGVGDMFEGGNQASRLRKVEVQKIPHQTCSRDYGSGMVFQDYNICAGVQGGGKDACQGDSGGPLVMRDGNKHVQVGIVSWGEGCGRPGFPGVYSRISAGMDWIKNIVCDCWGLSSEASFCDGSFTAAQFGCSKPTPAPTPDPNCQDTPGWTDSWGDTCIWFEENDLSGCPMHGPNELGALKHCCWCGGGAILSPSTSPKPTPRPTKPPSITPGCKDLEGFIDIWGDSCSWYEMNDSPGCPEYGHVSGGLIFTNTNVKKACCYCNGGSTGGSSPTPSPIDCDDLPGWVDAWDDGCDWYQANEPFGCPASGYIDGGAEFEGTSVAEACCWCGKGDTSIPSPLPTSPPDPPYAPPPLCKDMLGWKDTFGDSCNWYEENVDKGCIDHGSNGGGTGFAGITAAEACCFCGRSNTPTKAPSGNVFQPSEQNVSTQPSVTSTPTNETVPVSGATSISKYTVPLPLFYLTFPVIFLL